MRNGLSAEAAHFAHAVADALHRQGATAIARHAEADPARRSQVGALLDRLGVWELDPLADSMQLEAAAAACHAAGRVALPYPVAERIAAAAAPGVDAVAHVDRSRPRIAHGGLGLSWLAADQNGAAPVRGEGPAIRSKTGPFAADLEVGEWRSGDLRRLAVLVTLQGWTLLGMAEGAAHDTYAFVAERRQFGSTLASFQAIRFALTDAEVQLQGLAEIARYTLWSVRARGCDPWRDALALRLTALEAADVVFRVCHQSYGAMGLCDETDLSWFSRHSQPLRRLPWGRSRTEAEFLRALQAAPALGPFAPSAGVGPH
jgi:putative NIF3 family GTP cyclohydrolase 1 type 2